MSKTKFFVLILPLVSILTLTCLLVRPTSRAFAAAAADPSFCTTDTPCKPCTGKTVCTTPDDPEKDASKQCGKGKDNAYIPAIDLGCQGNNYRGDSLNPILDILLSFLRFITVGIGVLSIGSIIVAGIQFSASQGDPGATAKAIGRIANTVGAIFLYLIAWALLNWLVPGGIFNG